MPVFPRCWSHEFQESWRSCNQATLLKLGSSLLEKQRAYISHGDNIWPKDWVFPLILWFLDHRKRCLLNEEWHFYSVSGETIELGFSHKMSVKNLWMKLTFSDAKERSCISNVLRFFFLWSFLPSLAFGILSMAVWKRKQTQIPSEVSGMQYSSSFKCNDFSYYISHWNNGYFHFNLQTQLFIMNKVIAALAHRCTQAYD